MNTVNDETSSESNTTEVNEGVQPSESNTTEVNEGVQPSESNTTEVNEGVQPSESNTTDTVEPINNTVVIALGEKEIDHNPYVIRLSEGVYSENIPRDMDISAIKIINPDLELIDKISINIGGSEVLSYEDDEINNIILPENGLLLSKLRKYHTDIIIHFNKKYIKNNTTYKLINEYKIVEVDTNENVLIRDPVTGLVCSRCLVRKEKQPTGNKIKIPDVFPTILFPNIEITLQPKIISNATTISTIFWQKILINPQIDKIDKINRLVEKNKLQTHCCLRIEEKYAKGKPFYAKVQNELIYFEGIYNIGHYFN